MADRHHLLFHELLGKLGRITEEFGPEASTLELALWTALMNEEAAKRREEADKAKLKPR